MLLSTKAIGRVLRGAEVHIIAYKIVFAIGAGIFIKLIVNVGKVQIPFM